MKHFRRSMATSSGGSKSFASRTKKHTERLRSGFHYWSDADEAPPALGDRRWTSDLILATWKQSEGVHPTGLEYQKGDSGGGFDVLEFKFSDRENWLPSTAKIDTSLQLNRRTAEPMDLDFESIGMRCSIWCRVDRDAVTNVSHASLQRRAGLERRAGLKRRAGPERRPGLRQLNKARRACPNAKRTMVALRFTPGLP